MVVKVLARDSSNVSVLDRGPGVDDHEVQTLCRWVSSHYRSADRHARIGDFRLARLAPAEQGGNCFTFVADED